MTCAIEDTVKYVKFLAHNLGVCDVSCVVLAALLELDIPVYCDGFEYLKVAIGMMYENPFMTLVGEVYPAIAKKYNISGTYDAIDKAIGKAIQIAWENRDHAAWRKYFPGMVHKRSKRPTNTQFISGIAKITELWYRYALSFERRMGKEAAYEIK